MNTHLTHPQHPAPGDPERRVWLLAADGPMEVDVSHLAPGAMKSVEWQGRPVSVVRRTLAMLAALQGHDADLANPLSLKQQPACAANVERAIQPDFSSPTASAPTWDVRPTPHHCIAATRLLIGEDKA